MNGWAALALAAFQTVAAASPQESVQPDRPLSFESMETVLDGDSRITQLRSPVFTFRNRVIRATWALLWTDRDQASFLDMSDTEELRVGAPAVERTDPTEDNVGFNTFDELLS
ncbi:MAG: hypothetical protein AAFZ65_14560, partial [Planctomycetota bacterium]